MPRALWRGSKQRTAGRSGDIAKLLITCTGLYSNLSSSIALAEALVAAGHSVSFAAPAGTLEDITAAGFRGVEIGAPQLGVRSTYLPKPPFFKSAHLRRKRMDAGAKVLAADGFSQVLTRENPDVVLADCEHHRAIIECLGQGAAVVLLSFMYFGAPSVMSPPLTSAAVPGRGFWGTPMGIRALWAALGMKKHLTLARARRRHWGADLATAHRALAQTRGVALERVADLQTFQTPWGYHLPTLYLLDHAANLPAPSVPHHHFIGAVVRRRCRPAEDDQDYGAFFDANKSAKRIYCGFGSMRQPPPGFIARLLEVARRRTAWTFLLASKSSASDKLPDNVKQVPWAPQFAALERADCAIFHGGAGTFNECLATGTPMIVYPNALDGKGNGARVAYHKLGQIGRYRDSTDQIEARIAAVLASSDTANRLNAFQSRIAAGPSLDLIETVLRKARASR
ncbi:MAG: glycosyltransferase [Pseudomonadota bacterium]